jgi:hypothetical protein
MSSFKAFNNKKQMGQSKLNIHQFHHNKVYNLCFKLG